MALIDGQPPADFDPSVYKNLHDDLKNLSDEAARTHYINFGVNENRRYKGSPVVIPANFDGDTYKNIHTDLVHLTKENAEKHYKNFGADENRRFANENLSITVNLSETLNTLQVLLSYFNNHVFQIPQSQVIAYIQSFGDIVAEIDALKIIINTIIDENPTLSLATFIQLVTNSENLINLQFVRAVLRIMPTINLVLPFISGLFGENEYDETLSLLAAYPSSFLPIEEILDNIIAFLDRTKEIMQTVSNLVFDDTHPVLEITNTAMPTIRNAISDTVNLFVSWPETILPNGIPMPLNYLTFDGDVNIVCEFTYTPDPLNSDDFIDFLLIGGNFTKITNANGDILNRNYLATILINSSSESIIDELVTSLDNSFFWNPNIQSVDGGTVNAIVAYDNKIYIGGKFGAIMPYDEIYSSIERNNLASFSFTGSLDSISSLSINTQNDWSNTINNNLNSNAIINTLAVDADHLYVGGTNINQTNNVIAKYSTSTGDRIDSFSPQITNVTNDAFVKVINIAHDKLYVGGKFTNITINTEVSNRNGVAAFSVTDEGLDNDWIPSIVDANTTVNAIKILNDNVYIGGSFKTIGPNRKDIKFLLFEQFEFNGKINVIKIENNKIYVGGKFNTVKNTVNTTVLESSRNMLAIFDIDDTSIKLSQWIPSFPIAEEVYGSLSNEAGEVKDMAIIGNILYVVGNFNSKGTIAFNLVENVNNMDTDWNPIIQASVGNFPDIKTIVISDDNNDIYIGGQFNVIYGANLVQSHAAKFNTSGEMNTGWTPLFTNILSDDELPYVNALAIDNNYVYIGGRFRIGFDQYIVVVNKSDASVVANALENTVNFINNNVNVISVAPDKKQLYIGGVFLTAFVLLKKAEGQDIFTQVHPVNLQLVIIADQQINFINAIDISSDSKTVYLGGSLTIIKASDLIGSIKIRESVIKLIVDDDTNVKFSENFMAETSSDMTVNCIVTTNNGIVYVTDVNNNAPLRQIISLNSANGMRERQNNPFDGKNRNRNGVAAFDIQYANLNPYWNPNIIGQNVVVNSISNDNSDIYVAGNSINIPNIYQPTIGVSNYKISDGSHIQSYISPRITGGNVKSFSNSSNTYIGGSGITYSNPRISEQLSFPDIDNKTDIFPFWKPFGTNIIEGITDDEAFGSSVSLSSDGKIVAVAAPNLNDFKGIVRVYKIDDITREWQTFGTSSIFGNILSSTSHGFSVSLSSDGKIVAVGAPNFTNDGKGTVKVYKINESTTDWEVFGDNTILEGAENELFGFSVSLSSDGKIVAVGAPSYETNKGIVRVYKINEDTSLWEQFGNTPIIGDVGMEIGYSISLSNDGETIAFGTNSNAAPDNNTVRVYRFTEVSNVSDWIQIGSNIPGLLNETISLSGDGTTVAIGSPIFNVSQGFVHIYRYNTQENIWSLLGNNINGFSDLGGQTGSSVSLSDDGKIVAIGANSHKGEYGWDAGLVGVYKLSEDESSWIQFGGNINGIGNGVKFGSSVSLSGDGTIVAGGAPFHNNLEGLDGGAPSHNNLKGLVRVYDISLPSDNNNQQLPPPINNVPIETPNTQDETPNTPDETPNTPDQPIGDNFIINYPSDITEQHQTIMDDAFAKWNLIINGVKNTDLGTNFKLTINVLYDEGLASNVNGSASITSLYDTNNFTQSTGIISSDMIYGNTCFPHTGTLKINVSNLNEMASKIYPSSKTSLYYTMLHEIGHLLGIGIIWQYQLVQFIPVESIAEDSGIANLYYTGTHGLAEYKTVLNNQNLVGIPIEDNFSSPSHLEEGQTNDKTSQNNRFISGVRYHGLDQELMTPLSEISLFDMPLSRITIGLLEDLGYNVNYEHADPYNGPNRPWTEDNEITVYKNTENNPIDLLAYSFNAELKFKYFIGPLNDQTPLPILTIEDGAVFANNNPIINPLVEYDNTSGTVEKLRKLTLFYTPPTNFTGTVQFLYSVYVDEDTSNVNIITNTIANTSTITINVFDDILTTDPIDTGNTVV